MVIFFVGKRCYASIPCDIYDCPVGRYVAGLEIAKRILYLLVTVELVSCTLASDTGEMHETKSVSRCQMDIAFSTRE